MSSAPESPSPKKSARLAEKRKQREEGSGSSLYEDSIYFTPYSLLVTPKPQSPKGQKAENVRNQTPPLKESSPSPVKGRKSKSVSPLTLSPPKVAKKGRVTTPPIPSTSSSSIKASLRKSSSPDGEVKLKAKKSVQKPTVPLFNDEEETQLDGAQEEILAEEKWLDAVEAGNLDAFEEELNKSKTPKMLTARQRAILEKKENVVTSPDVVKKEEKIMSQEMIKIKAEKSEKRRILAREKKEKDKKKTMDRLLKKQQTRVSKTSIKPKANKLGSAAKIVYISRQGGNIIVFPEGKDLPIRLDSNKTTLKKPEIVLCGVIGCKNVKKYTCPKTTVPVCSLICYNVNLVRNLTDKK